MTGTLLLLLAAPGPWAKVDDSDGVELYERTLEGERLVELKVVTVSKLSVAALCTAAFGTAKLDPNEPDVTVRKLVSDDGGVRITYEQVSAPVINDRDYAVRAVKEELPDGSCRTRFEAANEYAPKKPDGFVRIEKLRGGFDVKPVSGSSVLTYTIFADPGGSVPALFIEGSRKKSAKKWVKMVIDRAAASGQARPP